MERNKIKNDKMIKNFQDLIEKTQKNMEATNEKSKNKITIKDRDIEILKNSIEEYKSKIQQIELNYSKKTEEYQNSIKN